MQQQRACIAWLQTGCNKDGLICMREVAMVRKEGASRSAIMRHAAMGQYESNLLIHVRKQHMPGRQARMGISFGQPVIVSQHHRRTGKFIAGS